LDASPAAEFRYQRNWRRREVKYKQVVELEQTLAWYLVRPMQAPQEPVHCILVCHISDTFHHCKGGDEYRATIITLSATKRDKKPSSLILEPFLSANICVVVDRKKGRPFHYGPPFYLTSNVLY
jgi:hypothetical protein